MKAVRTNISDVLVFEPEVFSDERGIFFESFNEKLFFELTGLRPSFVQDNHSVSTEGALHGLHYQIGSVQSKLVRVVYGQIFDVAVDLRKNSPTFGCWTGTVLSAENRRQMWIPDGFAHGFLVQSKKAEILYKVTNFYTLEHERIVLWSDTNIAVDWPIKRAPLLSIKDREGIALAEADIFT